MDRLIPLIILLVVGCTNPHTTSYILDTNPQGATVICDGQDTGYAPIVFNVTKNSDLVGEDRAFNEEDIAKIIEAEKIKRGELKVGENRAFTDEETKKAMIKVDVNKIVFGTLKVGEAKIFTDEEVKAVMEAIKIVDGELDIGEYTASVSAEEMQVAIRFVKEAKENTGSKCTAYWSSGVSEKYPYPIPFSYAGGRFLYTIQRPEGAGYTQDAEFALKVKELKQNQQTAELNALIAISGVKAQQQAAQAQERSARAQERQNNKSTSCYTNFGITTCY